MWEAFWESSDGRTFRTVGSIDDHVDKLRRYGVVRSRRYVEDALQAVFQSFLEKGKAVKEKVMVLRGFYLDENGKICTDRGDEIREDEFEERRGRLMLALEKLNEVSSYFPEETFGIVIKWEVA